MSTTVDRKLLEALVCPLTRGPLTWDRENNELRSRNAGLAYPVQEGVPVMIPDAARQIED